MRYDHLWLESRKYKEMTRLWLKLSIIKEMTQIWVKLSIMASLLDYTGLYWLFGYYLVNCHIWLETTPIKQYIIR